MSDLTGVSIEPFRGDLEGLEKMAHTSWRDEYGVSSFPNLYRPAFLRFLFGRLEHADHLLAAYRNGEIVCFQANLPHRFYFHQKICRGLWSGLMVSRKEWLRKGLAAAIIREAIHINDRYQNDFALSTFETGHRSTRVLKKLQAEGYRVERLKRLRVMGRIIDLRRAAESEGLKLWERAAVKLIGGDRPPRPARKGSRVGWPWAPTTPVAEGDPSAMPTGEPTGLVPGGRGERGAWPSDPNVREYRETDLDDCLSLFNSYGGKIQLARAWEREELGWELAFPDVSRTLVYEKDGHAQGAINFILHDHLGRTRERWAWINHVAYSALTPRQQAAFVQALLSYVRDQGGIGVIEWTKGYYSPGAFYRARFFPYFRSLDLYSWTFNPELSLSGVRACNEIVV
jgi:hypothetical protein